MTSVTIVTEETVETLVTLVTIMTVVTIGTVVTEVAIVTLVTAMKEKKTRLMIFWGGKQKIVKNIVIKTNFGREVFCFRKKNTIRMKKNCDEKNKFDKNSIATKKVL